MIDATMTIDASFIKEEDCVFNTKIYYPPSVGDRFTFSKGEIPKYIKEHAWKVWYVEFVFEHNINTKLEIMLEHVEQNMG